MKIILYSRAHAKHSYGELASLLNGLQDNGFEYQINHEFALQIESLMDRVIESDQIYHSHYDIDPQAQMMICYGGDGTFLEGVRTLDTLPIPVVGINSGRLGFLACIPKYDLSKALEDIKQGNYTTEMRTLLHIEGDSIDPDEYPYAINEFTIHRKSANMISTDLIIDSEMTATCWGDGMLISTPTGSTAYSLSVGGPIVAPNCNCFVISPIAPHNLTMRPIVIPDTSELTLKVHTRERELSVSIDNRHFSVPDGATFTVKKAEKSIFLIKLQNISFYDTLSSKMMWGIDRRDQTQSEE